MVLTRLEWVMSVEGIRLTNGLHSLSDNEFLRDVERNTTFLKLSGDSELKRQPLDFDTAGLTEVSIVGKEFYHVFRKPDDSLLEVVTTEKEYRDLALRDAPQPTKDLEIP